MTSFEESTTFDWESVTGDGLSNVDLSAIQSANSRTFQTPGQSMSFDLVLPASSLDSASNYSFKLVGTVTSTGASSSATADVATRSGPFDGHFEVRKMDHLISVSSFY